MKNKTLRNITLSQIIVLFLFFCSTVLNEVVDLPHYLFGDVPTAFGQRTGEIIVEAVIFTTVLAIEIFLLRKLYSRIRLLEGFLPICAKCKKIRKRGEWEQVEKYITEHSLAQFSHSICPECAAQLYPEFYANKQHQKPEKSI